MGTNTLTFLDMRFNFFSGSVTQKTFTQNLEILFINNNNVLTQKITSKSKRNIRGQGKDFINLILSTNSD